jgi:Ca2+-binding RTX toxin-like protein
MTAGNAGPAQAVPSAASAAVAPLDQGFYTTTTTLTSSATQGSVGEMITLTATVKVQIGTPTGTVQFSIDNKPYGSPVSLSYPNAQASISLNTLTAGVHVVTAAYVSAIPVLYDDSESAPLDITLLATATVGANLAADPIVPGQLSLAVKGGSGNETIAVYPGGTNQIVVKILGPTPYQGTFSTTQLAHLVFYGGSGNNSLWIEPGVKIPAVLIGGSGNNTFIGGQGPAIMVGGSGHNIERAGTGPTVMIAGSGVSSLYGNTGYDLLIGGATNFDTNTTGLDSILAEWGDISAGFHSRVKLLEGLPNPKTGLPKGGLNGTDFLDSTTVQAGSDLDTLSGGSSDNWFLVSQAQQTDGCLYNVVFTKDVVTYVG